MGDITVGSEWVCVSPCVDELKVLETSKDEVVYQVIGGSVYVIGRVDFLKEFKPKEQGRKDDSSKPKHSHYHKDVSDYDTIDIYAVCKIFDVQDTSGCLQHAIKKLLVTGKRGHKDRKTDIQNAIDTLNRLLALEHE